MSVRRLCKTLIFSSALITSALFVGLPAAAATENSVKVQLNDNLVEFQEAKPFIDAKEQLQVPVRPIAEKLGYQCDWSIAGSDVNVSIRYGERFIMLKSGDNFAYVNGNKVSLQTNILLIDGSMYLPLRFITEAFGIGVQWDDNNGLVIVNADGKYHAPAWYAPKKSDQIVQFANKHIGVRYMWGGRTPQGFDCSGFVQYVFAQYGITLPRSSREMYDHAGSKVNDPEPGDIVVFSGHVGIYLGNNQFISATTTYGVHVDSLENPYWRSKYIGAKRIV